MFGILGLLAFPLAFGSAIGAAFAARKILFRRLNLTAASRRPADNSKPAPAVPWSRRIMVVALAGTLAYLLAVTMFTLSSWLFGAYPAPKPTEQIEPVVKPVPGNLAEQAGIRIGDRIVSIGGDSIDRWPSLLEAIKRHEGKEVDVVVERAGSLMTTQLTLPVPGRLGVWPMNEKVKSSLPAALGKGLTQPFSIIGRTAGAIFRALIGSHKQELAGPVTIVKETSRDTFGTGEMLMLYAAVMSYITIPLSLVVAMVISLRSSEEESTPSVARVE